MGDRDIVAENIRAMGPLIFAAMFDELKVFQAADRIVEQFRQGTLPIGSGQPGRLLHAYWREVPKRMSAQERRSFAALTLGIIGGAPRGAGNRAFDALWRRFLASVSEAVRPEGAGSADQQGLREAARGLARTLSEHGSGPAGAAARRLKSEIDAITRLLQDPEILRGYGARDMWQLIDRIGAELGGARNAARHRRLATAGATIAAWLARNLPRIEREKGPLIRAARACNPAATSKRGATRHPTDYDLANACELWLAEMAIGAGKGSA